MKAEFVAIVLLAFAGAARAAPVAQIVSLQGKGEWRLEQERDWREARLKQGLDAGNFVRTLELSRMGILFVDQTQIRLNQNSMIQIKQVGDARERRTTINLPFGRGWVQSKAVPQGLTIETPSAVAAIRGTEWEIDVDQEGRATLTVMAGEVDFSNEYGAVVVAASEQAVAEKGRAPVKRIIQNPRERVQWVSAYVVSPERYAELRDEAALKRDREGERLLRVIALIREDRLKPARDELEAVAALPDVRNPAAFLLLSDFHIYAGDFAEALRALDAGRARFEKDERFDAQAARIHLFSDDAARARARLDDAFAKNPQSVEAHLVAGELARFLGDAAGASAAFRAAATVVPEDARGWHGLGLVETEREDVPRARDLLMRAIALDPRGPGYAGELATLETFADNLAEARRRYEAALEAQPDDYVALTGLGVLELKAGSPERALESLLKASLIEPRYARVHLYVAVAYYQQGRVDPALAELKRATELDPKDPFPHILASLIYNDLIRPGEALEEARQALAKMPYLKSLNQIANNQKGSANLGSALALFGLEEWARSTAHQSYYPYWSGSHLFLADRYSGDFNKNSELFQGFLADPTVFGASNRFQSLTTRPGNYGAVGLLGARSRELESYEASVTLNGYANENAPLAYFANGAHARISPGLVNLTSTADSFTGALGAKPDSETGLFAFAKNLRTRNRLDGDRIDTGSSRLDLGAHRKLSPTSQLWVKAGAGRDDATLATEGGGLRFAMAPQARDLQLRHTFAFGEGHELTWGLERASLKDATSLSADLGGGAMLEFSEPVRRRTFDAYISGRVRASERLLLQADAAWQDFERTGVSDIRVDIPGDAPIVIRDQIREARHALRPRLGAVYQFAPARLVRVAYQNWMRPVSVATLAPVATAGIPVDDQLVAAGGRLERLRGQIEWEVSPRSFLSAFVDRERINNFTSGAGLAAASQATLEDLDRLRNRTVVNVATLDTLEDRPEFDRGRVTAFGGAWNQVFSRSWSGYLRYHYAKSENTGTALAGRMIPFLPRDRFALGLTWVGASRVYASAQLLYRSARFADEANLVPLRSGWEGVAAVTWESEDKRWALQGAVNGLFKRDAHSTAAVNAVYRF